MTKFGPTLRVSRGVRRSDARFQTFMQLLRLFMLLVVSIWRFEVRNYHWEVVFLFTMVPESLYSWDKYNSLVCTVEIVRSNWWLF